MKTQLFRLFSFVLVVVLLLSGSARFANAQEGQPPTPPVPNAPPPGDPHAGPRQDQNGQWYMPEEQAALMKPANQALLATGGPDDFGYTWNDSNPYYWIDARAGTDTHLGLYSVTDLIGLGFTFKFYENSYSDIYISSVGAVGFSSQGLSGTYPVPVPSSQAPNNFIAPFFSPPLRFNAGGIYTGTVYYLQGGTEPNRYFVVEWYGGYDYTNGPYTFEVILYENGNIDFNYQSMVQQSYVQCDPPTEVAIENAYGDDGLAYIQAGCQYVTSLTGKTVRFARPASSARTQVSPKFQGTFARPGETITFQTFIRNTGDFGSDTYDLSSNSTWPVTFYAADGTTPLSDTNGNGKIDTGALAQASVFTVTVKAQAPLTATLGATNIFSLIVQSSLDSTKSKTVTMQAAVPAPFVQVYRDYADDAMSLYLVSAQMVKKATGEGYTNCSNCDSGTSVAEIPGGNLIYAWKKIQNTGNNLSIQNIEYTLFNKYGEVIREVSRLTDNGNATMQTEDGSPVLAPLSDGYIGITWDRWILDQNTFKSNYNIYFAILDAAGNLDYGPANITNNSAFSSYWSDLNVLQYSNPHLAAIGDNRFVLTWEGRMNVAPSGSCTSNCYVADVYYAILDANGATVKSITKFTNSTAGGSVFYSPVTTALSTNHVLLAYITSNYNIAYAILDSGGGIIKGETNLGQKGYGLVARQLSDGRTILAWHTEASPYTGIQFAILDSAYNLLSGPTALDNPAAPPNNAGWIGSSLSVASDSNNHAILTWGDTDGSYRPNLYYALVNSDGSVLTPPMIFRTSRSNSPYISPGSQGQGNATYSSVPTGADGVVSFTAPVFGGTPGGVATVNVNYTNHGLATMTDVVLTATLANSPQSIQATSTDGLIYLGDTSGITPTVTGNTVIWDLPPLNFLDDRQFALYVRVPVSATIGTRYSVGMALTSSQADVNPSDNAATTEVIASLQLFLPLIRR